MANTSINHAPIERDNDDHGRHVTSEIDIKNKRGEEFTIIVTPEMRAAVISLKEAEGVHDGAKTSSHSAAQDALYSDAIAAYRAAFEDANPGLVARAEQKTSATGVDASDAIVEATHQLLEKFGVQTVTASELTGGGKPRA